MIDILVDLRLQLPNLVEGTFREQSEVARIPRQDFGTKSFQAMIKALNLLNCLL